MRLTSLLLLVAIVGGAGYVLVFQRPWLVGLFKKTVETAEGYAAAKTPTEAMEYFTKAVKARKLETAAKYVTGPFADQFTRGAAADSGVGSVLDEIKSYAEDKGILNDRTRLTIYFFDPFPTSFKIKGTPKEAKDDTTVGYFVPDGVINIKNVDARSVDLKMLTTCLMPGGALPPDGLLYKGTTIVKEGKGEEASWKLKFDLSDGQYRAINYYLENYKGYETALRRFRGELTNNRYDSKDAFEREFLDVFRQSK